MQDERWTARIFSSLDEDGYVSDRHVRERTHDVSIVAVHRFWQLQLQVR